MPFDPYRIPSFGVGAGGIPAFGGYGADDAAYDQSLRAALFPGADPNAPLVRTLSGAYYRSSNPNPFSRGGIDAKTGYETRKRAKRIYAPSMAALVAQNALLGPTLELQRRASMGYADLFGDVAPQYLDAYRGADPETSGLLNLLNIDARSLLGRGGSDPYADRELEQNIRGAQSARGLALSPQGAYEELIKLDRARDERRMARGRYAGEIEEAGRRYYSPALMALMLQNQSPVQGTSTDDLLSLSLNDTAQRRNEQAARRAGQMALTGQIIGSVLGAAGAAAGCWVAEVLYGIDDPRTHLARAWVRAHPANAFVRLYQRQGKRWANWLRANPWAKLWVQPIWDAMWRAGVKEIPPRTLPVLLSITLDRQSQIANRKS